MKPEIKEGIISSDLKILLVEDNPGDIRLTQEALKEIIPEADIHVSKDGKEAYEHLESGLGNRERPQLILLDLNLPKMGGMELLDLLKSHSELKRIPVIILTTSDREEDIKLSYDLHANCYLTKPVELEPFLKVVRSIKSFWLENAVLPPV